MDFATLTWFIAGASLVLLVSLVFSGSASRAHERLSELADSGAGPSLFGGSSASQRRQSAVDSDVARRLRDEERQKKLKARIVQAGLYGRNATMLFFFTRLLALIVPVSVGLVASALGMIPLVQGLTVGGILGAAGLLLPSFWLDYKKRRRQENIRRALPDALDVVSVCLEGGMSLPASLARVCQELAAAHPMLALELAIVERETQLGRTTGQALREFANRFDLEELRSLSAIVNQAERFGSSVTSAMETYSETLREKRRQRAEELAQKAVIKIIFPTLLCIFPGIFVVVIGPAMIQIYQSIIQGVFRHS